MCFPAHNSFLPSLKDKMCQFSCQHASHMECSANQSRATRDRRPSLTGTKFGRRLCVDGTAGVNLSINENMINAALYGTSVCPVSTPFQSRPAVCNRSESFSSDQKMFVWYKDLAIHSNSFLFSHTKCARHGWGLTVFLRTKNGNLTLEPASIWVACRESFGTHGVCLTTIQRQSWSRWSQTQWLPHRDSFKHFVFRAHLKFLMQLRVFFLSDERMLKPDYDACCWITRRCHYSKTPLLHKVWK